MTGILERWRDIGDHALVQVFDISLEDKRSGQPAYVQTQTVHWVVQDSKTGVSDLCMCRLKIVIDSKEPTLSGVENEVAKGCVEWLDWDFASGNGASQ